MFRRLFLVFLLITVGCVKVNAQGYCCDRENASLEYVRKYSDGKFCWRHIMTVTEVTQTGPMRKISTSSTFLKSNGKQLYNGPALEQMILDDKDNVRADMGLAIASYMKARTGMNATATGPMTEIPSNLEPGDTLAPVVVNARLGILNYVVKAYDRKVLRREKISVPAGTFDCIVLEERRIEKGPGHNRDVRNLTWYCKGVGYVRHDTFIKGVLYTSEILYKRN